MLIVGDKERTSQTVAVRQHKHGDTGIMPVGEFIGRITREINEKILT
jgi:threonyl-tRNA synthetase